MKQRADFQKIVLFRFYQDVIFNSRNYFLQKMDYPIPSHVSDFQPQCFLNDMQKIKKINFLHWLHFSFYR